MNRELVGDIHWIHETPRRPEFEETYAEQEPSWYRVGTEVYSIHNAYLIRGEKTLLFDTLTPASSRQIIDELTELLGDRPLDYLVVSHPEGPHAGNAFKILEEYPEAVLIAPDSDSAIHELYHLENAVKVRPSDYVDLGDYVVEFVEPFFLDHEMHVWMFERTTKTLFTVDWIGMNVMESERLKFVDELETGLTVERVLTHNGYVFFWWAYADTAKTDAAIETILELYDPALVANAHGLPIRENVGTHLRTMKKVIRHVREHGRKGVL